MQYGKVGNSTLKCSRIILGTWQAGKDSWADIDDKDTTRAIRGAIDFGITSIDTASIYGNGYSEKIIGNALAAVSRGSYQLATKVWVANLKSKQVIAQCEQSLKNLQTDFIDLYQIHWPSGAFNSEIVAIAETMEALNKLKTAGKIKNIGLYNFSKVQLQEAMQYGDIVSNQVPYSLLWRYYDQDANPFCRASDIAILAYSPLAQGILTGKFKRNHVFKAGDHRSANKLMQSEVFANIEMVLEGMREYAYKYHTTLGNIALNWLSSQPNTFAIVGMRNLAQVEDTSKCCDFQLTEAELKEIDYLSTSVTQNMVQDGLLWQW